ncbi:MAG: replication initiator protein A [Pseudomonadales bacterium]|nr:replication initiator protein A [Pseudomonadales bacterium]
MSDKILKDMIKKMEGYGSKAETPKTTSEEPINNALSNYFVCDLQNYSFKDDVASMEAPIFSLSTQEDKQLWVWTSEDGKKTVEVAPSVYGRATVFDKDVLIFAASQLMAGINKGETPSKTIRFKARDYLKATMRNERGDDYDRFKASLKRLNGTQITTNIKTGKYSSSKGFGIIDNWEIIEKDENNSRMIAVELTLSNWLYNAIISGELLTITPKYFEIRKPLERRLYEIARKHVGRQDFWKISLDKLKDKCGSIRELKKFRLDMKNICISDNIPDYNLSLSDDIVTFFKR